MRLSPAEKIAADAADRYLAAHYDEIYDLAFEQVEKKLGKRVYVMADGAYNEATQVACIAAREKLGQRMWLDAFHAALDDAYDDQRRHRAC